MSKDPIEIKIDNKAVNERLFELAKRGENLRPLMKNIAGVFAYSAEENFENEGRPKWTGLKEITKKARTKIKKWPGKILQVEGMLASSLSTQYDENSAIIGSNLPYAAIHQKGGKAGKNKKVEIPARPYLQLSEDDFSEILTLTEKYFA